MAINSRNKGAAGERELARLLFDELGARVHRNLEQARTGGYDLVCGDGILAPYAIEVKRHSEATHAKVERWWLQAEKQAVSARLTPVLVYRGDRQPWRVKMPLNAVSGDYTSETMELSFPDFCAVVRNEARP